MATRDPPIPESLRPVSNKMQDRMNVLREVIQSKKALVHRAANEMKTRIDNRTMDIIKQLDAVWERANTRVTQKRDEMEKTIAEVNRLRSGIETQFSKHNQHPSLAQIDDSISSMRQELDVDIPFVSLSWRLSELRDCIDGMCVCETKDVTLRNDLPLSLKWSCGERGEEENQIYAPQGVAIDEMNDRVYVACQIPSRVQIFSMNGGWIKCLKNEQMIQPEYLLCLNDSLFIQCNKSILLINISTLQLMSHREYEYSISGICTDNNLIYVSQYSQMKLSVLSLELEDNNEITLNTKHKQDNTRIWDLSYVRDEFYVSFSDSEYSLQSFSQNGELTRCILHRDTVQDVYHFCVDQQLNIIVSDKASSNVKIFTNDGKLVTQFGKRGTGKGQFQYLHGLAIDDRYSIITVDCKNENIVQLFSPL